MNRNILASTALLMLVLFAPVSRAQAPNSLTTDYDERPRLLFGNRGGSSFGNYFYGLNLGVEIPFARRYELDLEDTFSPIESHIALGSGWSNSVSGGGQFWLVRGLGLNGSAVYSNYSVTTVSKGAYYAFTGVTLRKIAWGVPTRFLFDYFREFKNGISANGTESGHLQGGAFTMVSRLGCSRSLCVRTDLEIEVGHLLTQGNPVCDGTYGITGGPNGGPCYRTGAWSGGATMAFVLEFPGGRAYQDIAF